jgi:hypothetical protein
MRWKSRKFREPLTMAFDETSEYQSGVALSDRIGRHAGPWFQDRVAFWSEPDGIRLYDFELSDLGRHVVLDVLRADLEEAKSILSEVEAILADEEIDDRNTVLSLLDGLDAEMLDLAENDPQTADSVRTMIEQAMGPATRSRSR